MQVVPLLRKVELLLNNLENGGKFQEFILANEDIGMNQIANSPIFSLFSKEIIVRFFNLPFLFSMDD